MTIPDLTLRDLTALVAVAQHKHFGRAASAMRVAQPTLSAQVQKAERVLGVRIFDRSARRFGVTPEGERLLPMVLDLVAGAERLGLSAGARGGVRTPIRLGIIPTLGPYLAPYLLGPDRQSVENRRGRPPRPALLLSEQVTEHLVESLRDGQIDAALLSMPVRFDWMETIALFDEPFRLIAQRGCSLLNRAHLTSACLSAEEMVLLDEGHCLREQSLDLCGRRRGGSPRVITTSLETLKHVVASGGGYSLIPQLATELPEAVRGLVEVRAFEDRKPRRRIGLCFRKSSARSEEMRGLAGWIASRLPASVSVLATERRHAP